MEYTLATNRALKNPVKLERVIYTASLAICCAAVVYLLTVFLTGESWLPAGGIPTGSSELLLSFIQCLLGAAALHLPMLIAKIAKIKLPDMLCAFFYVFVICGTVLGELFSLYYAIPVWDSLLHFSSGIMTGMLGGILLVNLLKAKQCGNLIFPLSIAVSAMCFAICIGVVWEIYEFAGDALLGLNMQKWALQDGTERIGRAALFDTMKDLLLDFCGAALASAAAYTSLKNRKGWLYAYQRGAIVSPVKKERFESEGLPRSA